MKTRYILIFLAAMCPALNAAIEKHQDQNAKCHLLGVKEGARVAFSEEGVYYNRQEFKNLTSKFDDDLGTYVVTSKKSVPIEDSAFTGILLHGNGSVKSHVGTVLNQIGIIGAANKKKKRSRHNKEDQISLRGEVFAHASFKRSRCFGLDLPFHGQGPRLERYLTLKGYLKWMDVALRKYKKSNGGKPLVLFARSGSAALIAEYNMRYSGVVDVLVGLNPQNPNFIDNSIDKIVNSGHRDQLDMPLVEKIREFNHAMKWHLSADPFGSMKTIFLIGRRDPELSKAYADGLADIISRDSDAKIHFIEKAGHDALAPKDIYTGADQKHHALEAYKLAYDYLASAGI